MCFLCLRVDLCIGNLYNLVNAMSKKKVPKSRVLSSYFTISICTCTTVATNILSVNPYMFSAFRDCRNGGFVSRGLFTTPV